MMKRPGLNIQEKDIDFTEYHGLDGFVQDIGEGNRITLDSIEGIQVS